MKKQRLNPLHAQKLNDGAIMSVAGTADYEKDQAKWCSVAKGMQIAVNSQKGDGRFAARRAFLGDFVSDDEAVTEVSVADAVRCLMDRGHYFGVTFFDSWYMLWMIRQNDTMHVFEFLYDKKRIGSIIHRVISGNAQDLLQTIVPPYITTVPKSRAKDLLLAIRLCRDTFSQIIHIAEDIRRGQYDKYSFENRGGASVYLRTPHGNFYCHHVEHAKKYEYRFGFRPYELKLPYTAQQFVADEPYMLRYREVYHNMRNVIADHLRPCHAEELTEDRVQTRQSRAQQRDDKN